MSGDHRATIAIVLLSEQGAFNASFAFAKRLQERGFRILYVGQQRFRALVERQGFVFFCPHGDSSRPDSAALQALSPRRRRGLIRRYNVLDYLQSLRALEQWLRVTDVDLVLLDPLMVGYAPAPLAAGTPIVGLNTTLATVWGSTVPPVFSSLIPRPTGDWVDRARNITAWSRLRLRFWRRRLRSGLPRRIRFGSRFVRCHPAALVRRAGGHLRWGEYGWRLDVPELVMAPRELDFERVSTWTRRLYLGASVDPERKDSSFEIASLPSLSPLVYCSLGTYSGGCRFALQFFTAVIRAFNRHPEWGLVVQAGHLATDPTLQSPAPQIVIAEQVPQLRVLERAALHITHGGFSSVRESVFFGVPMLVVPWANDGYGNAARVVYHGLGRRARIDRVTESSLEQMVAEMLEDAAVRAAARRMQQIVRPQQDYRAGVEFVEELLAGARAGVRRVSPVTLEQTC